MQEGSGAYDPFGALITNVQPPSSGPPPNVPFYGATYGGASWNSFTDANNLTTGCTLDGVRTNCNKVVAAIGAGMIGKLGISTVGTEASIANIGIFISKSPVPSAPPKTAPSLKPGMRTNPEPGNLNPYGVAADEIQYFTRVSFSSEFLSITEPQNSTQKLMDTTQTEKMLTEDCLKFLNSILAQLKDPHSKDLLDILKAAKGHLFTRNLSDEEKKKRWGGTHSIVSNPASYIELDEAIYGNDPYLLIHELFHGARGSGDVYTQPQPQLSPMTVSAMF